MIIRKDKVNDELIVSIRGDISEKAEDAFGKLLESELDSFLVFDLSKVQMINSIGVRVWILMVSTLKKRQTTIAYRNCSTSIIETLNIFPHFINKKEIESVFIPTCCVSCDYKDEELSVLKSLRGAVFSPSKLCPSCGIAMTVEIDLDDYLFFLKDD